MPDPLDRQMKLVDMQVKILAAVASFNKTMADAEKVVAETQSIIIANQIKAMIAHQMELAFRALNRHKHLLEEEKERITEDKKKTAIFITGFKPASLTALAATFAAFNRGLSRLDGESVFNFNAVPVAAKHRSADNFVAIGSGGPFDPPTEEDVDNLGLLMAWIAASGVFFKKAKPAHMLLLKSFDLLTKGIDARIKELEAEMAKVGQADLGQIESLVLLAGIPGATVKPPAPK